MSGGAAPEVVTVGETMAMLAPSRAEALAGADTFRLDAGGAESNVAAHLAALGVRVAWFSRLGDDALGRRVARQLAGRGVDVFSVRIDPAHRTGLYVKDSGAPVVYYRSDSAASHLGVGDVDAVPLAGARVLHVSGVTAAISASAHDFLVRLMTVARGAGVTISFDVNHRPALWERPVAAATLHRLAKRADLVFVGRDEAQTLWDTATPADVRAQLPAVPELVVKDAEVGATVYTGGQETFAPSERVTVVDAVGAGDAFAGGYLAALLAGAAPAERLRAGHARAALTLTTTGDSVEDGDRP